MSRWRISADCWTRRGKHTTWTTIITAPDRAAALDQADRTLARAGHHRFNIRATPVEEQNG